jgi:hypothetical protein
MLDDVVGKVTKTVKGAGGMQLNCDACAEIDR